jgi:hypothetical protein
MMVNGKVVGNPEEDWEILTDGGEEDTGDKTTEEGGDDGTKSPDMSEAKDKLYPDDDKKDPDKAEADKEPDGDKEAEDKSEDDKSEEDKAKDKDDKEKEGKEGDAEVITAEDITFPEGVEVNAEIQKDFLEIANDKDMSTKDKAQALVDLQAKLYAEAHQSKLDNWVSVVKDDKKFVGDDGTKLPENLALAKKGMEALGIEGLSEYLDASGEGNNPLMVEAFMKIGASISEDTFIVGGKGAKTDTRTPAQVLYGK